MLQRAIRTERKHRDMFLEIGKASRATCIAARHAAAMAMESLHACGKKYPEIMSTEEVEVRGCL